MQGLADVAHFLADPEWLIYQWGVLGPFGSGKSLLHLDLERIVLLGHELRDLSRHEGFSYFLKSFSNPTQFNDCLFEAHIASMFGRLNATKSLVLGPVHVVRGREKHPEFDIETSVGPLSVECKQRHPYAHESSERLRSIASAIQVAMDAAGWPDHLRLEVELTGPIREQTAAFAKHAVETALRSQPGVYPPMSTQAKIYVISKQSPFCIKSMQAGHDVMVLGSGQASGLFNPEITKLRVAVNNLDDKIAKVVGAQINSALKQLPEDRFGIIMLGSVPIRIGMEAIERRIDSPAYDNVLAFGVSDDDQLHFGFRESRRDVLDKLMTSGMRPLFATS